MSDKYIPQSDSGIACWAGNFSALISAAPGEWGLTVAEAASIAGAAAAFQNALTIATQSSTRTAPAIVRKNDARTALLQTVRYYAQTIKRNPGISDKAKVALGLHIDALSPHAVPAPAGAPQLFVTPAAPLQHTLRFTDSDSPHRRAKPFGAKGLLVFISIGDAPPLSPEQASFHGMATRSPYTIFFESENRGKTACYYARWMSATGLMGPWSTCATLLIP